MRFAHAPRLTHRCERIPAKLIVIGAAVRLRGSRLAIDQARLVPSAFAAPARPPSRSISSGVVRSCLGNRATSSRSKAVDGVIFDASLNLVCGPPDSKGEGILREVRDDEPILLPPGGGTVPAARPRVEGNRSRAPLARVGQRLRSDCHGTRSPSGSRTRTGAFNHPVNSVFLALRQ